MRKSIAIILFLGLIAPALSGQTATMTAPKSGDSWVRDTTQPITWTWSGAASVKLVLVSQSAGNMGIIKSGLALGAGSYAWKVGTLEDGKSVPAKTDYKVRIVVVASNAILDASPLFAIGEPTAPPPAGNPAFVKGGRISQGLLSSMVSSKSIAVSQPVQGEVWAPLKTYNLKWSWLVRIGSAEDDCKASPGCAGTCAVDAWLVPAAAPTEKIFLVKNHCSTYNYHSQGMVIFSGAYSGIVPNLAAGSYFLRVARCDKPAFFGDSPTFTLKLPVG